MPAPSDTPRELFPNSLISTGTETGVGSRRCVSIKRLNVGCGMTPTLGWRNYDNSWSIRLARRPWFLWLMDKVVRFNEPQKRFIAFAQQNQIRWANVARRIPESDSSVDVIYSSHMFEHLDGPSAGQFLGEARRVLHSGGILRLAVPNIRFHVDNYMQSGDADLLIENMHMARECPRTLLDRLWLVWVGKREHQWMYDGPSLSRVLESAGFTDVQVMPPGSTRILDPGELDLRERYPESVFVEGVNP